MTLYWHGVHVYIYMIMHTRVMYDTGSISFAADLLCQLTTHNTAQSTQRERDRMIHPGKTLFHYQQIDFSMQILNHMIPKDTLLDSPM